MLYQAAAGKKVDQGKLAGADCNKSQSSLSALAFYAFEIGHSRKLQNLWNRTSSVRVRSSLGF